MQPFPYLANEVSSSKKEFQRKYLLQYFLLVFTVSIPFWLIGAVTKIQLLPGLPLSSLMVMCPLMAASILVYKENNAAGVVGLLKRSFDYHRIGAKIWYAPILLLMPGVMVLTVGLRGLLGLELPTFHFRVQGILVMFIVFFIAALGEELGWSGYAMDPMQKRWNALQASIILGSIWAIWHIVPLVQANRSSAWISWWCLFTVGSRVLIVWLYNNAGRSVFVAALYHAVSNVSVMLFPNLFDPRITGMIIVCIAIIVTVIWGPRTLAKNNWLKE